MKKFLDNFLLLNPTYRLEILALLLIVLVIIITVIVLTIIKIKKDKN